MTTVRAFIAAGLLAFALFGALVAACGGDDDDDDAGNGGGATEDGGDGNGGGGLEITATDNEFDTDELTAPADTETTLVLTNEGSALHNWAVPAEGVEMDLVSGGEQGETSFNLPAGEYEYLC